MHLPPFWEDCKTSPVAGLIDARVIRFARQGSPFISLNYFPRLFQSLVKGSAAHTAEPPPTVLALYSLVFGSCSGLS